MQGEVALPKMMHTYKDDFGGSDEAILRFVFRYFQGADIDEETVIKEVCQRRSMMIRYD